MQVAMPWLTDARCKQKYPQVDATNAICAGETGDYKDTCQVNLNTSFNLFKLIKGLI